MSVEKIADHHVDPRAPHDLEAEHVVLGCLMFDNPLADVLSDQIAAEMFFEPTHARIFRAILQIVQSGRHADPVTVFDALGLDAGLQSLGGKGYLADLVEKAPMSTVALGHAKIIRSLWQRRELIKIGEETAQSARNAADPDALIETAEAALLQIQINSRAINLVSAEEAISSVIAEFDNPSIAFGTKIGLTPIDDVSGGFMPGELWLLAGRPGAGKSAIASTAALHVCQSRNYSNEPTGAIEICSEMTVQQMMRRHIADTAYEIYGREAPSYSAIRKRAISREQRRMFDQAAAKLRKLGTLRSLYRTGLTVHSLRAIIRRQISGWARQGVRVGLVTVDHVGLLKSSANVRSRTESQGEVAREMKELAGELNIPILALVQLNRKVEERDDKRPMLSDLRDSGEWEENADGVIGCFREAYYAQREPEPKRQDLKLLWDERRCSPYVDAIFMKIREGEMQTVRLWADMARNAIRGQAPDNAYHAPLFDPLDPDQPLPAFDASAFE